MVKVKAEMEEGITEALISVKRVTTVAKGGRRFSFAAVVIAGNKGGREEGKVGYGKGKANEVTEAREKAGKEARRNLIKISLHEGRTIHHDVMGQSGAARVILRKAKAGTGVIAGGPMRAVFEFLGVHDIVAKSLGSNNVYSIIAATFNALSKLSSPLNIAEKRNKNLGELYTKTNKKLNSKINKPV